MLSRRVFMKNGGLALLSLGFAPAFLSRTVEAAGAVRRKVLITIFQRGAVDGLNMVVPFGEKDYYAARPSIAIPRPGGAEGAVGRPETREPCRHADVGATATARITSAARVGWIRRDALPGAGSVQDDAAELVTEHERAGQACVPDQACIPDPALAMVAAVVDETSPASASPARDVPARTPRILLLTSCRAKFMRLSSAPVLTHASARSA